MRTRSMTIRRVMLAVALIAVDLAYLQGNVNFLVAVPVLQVGLFSAVSSRGVIRPFWMGFEMGGWAGVIVYLLGVGPLWFRFLDQQLNDAVTRIERSHPDVAGVLATVLLCEGTPIQDTTPGLLPEALLAGMPILLLAIIGGLIATCPVFQRGRLRPSPSVSPEL